ncbi:hypothetical protein [Pseudooctadecabacter jejudonensis]|uniref:Uncharacterized protein n=1 Tax=Pseudooctadecabacter jejudonensis TaxID=1391910 RepID=A0A1Y5TBJ5_9RHOB|nr:hypothetical protein [Pseudooctadecabacter jejudonensis]SLN60245.1 hypothetical protein PSJ8397_03212 [Pseudooctadecabacter jejudonensis]
MGTGMVNLLQAHARVSFKYKDDVHPRLSFVRAGCMPKRGRTVNSPNRKNVAVGRFFATFFLGLLKADAAGLSSIRHQTVSGLFQNCNRTVTGIADTNLSGSIGTASQPEDLR